SSPTRRSSDLAVAGHPIGGGVPVQRGGRARIHGRVEVKLSAHWDEIGSIGAVLQDQIIIDGTVAAHAPFLAGIADGKGVDNRTRDIDEPRLSIALRRSRSQRTQRTV